MIIGPLNFSAPEPMSRAWIWYAPTPFCIQHVANVQGVRREIDHRRREGADARLVSFDKGRTRHGFAEVIRPERPSLGSGCSGRVKGIHDVRGCRHENDVVYAFPFDGDA